MLNGVHGRMSTVKPSLFFWVGSSLKPRPIGGLTVIFQTVLLARQLTERALVIAPPDATYYFDHQLTADAFAEPSRIQPGDVVIFPETDLRPVAAMPAGVRRWIYCQNHHYIFNQRATMPDWTQLDIECVLCSSKTILGFVKEAYPAIPAWLLPCHIDHSRLAPAPKTLQIAFMPRKRQREAQFLRGALERLYPRFADVGWIEIDKLPFADVAEILRHSKLFLALGRLEGLGLPALEAMTAGCLVVGFPGGGGAEYATPVNGLWCSDDDLPGAVWQLARALELATDKPSLADEIIAQGRQTALRYSADQTMKRLTRILTARAIL